jgi:hypothetical protein
MQAMVGYMACGTAFFDTFFIESTNAGLSVKPSAIGFAATAGMRDGVRAGKAGPEGVPVSHE